MRDNSPITLNVSNADGWRIAFFEFRISTLETTLWSGLTALFLRQPFSQKLDQQRHFFNLTVMMIWPHVYGMVQNSESDLLIQPRLSLNFQQAVRTIQCSFIRRIQQPYRLTSTSNYIMGSVAPLQKSKLHIAQSGRSWNSKRRLDIPSCELHLFSFSLPLLPTCWYTIIPDPPILKSKPYNTTDTSNSFPLGLFSFVLPWLSFVFCNITPFFLGRLKGMATDIGSTSSRSMGYILIFRVS